MMPTRIAAAALFAVLIPLTAQAQAVSPTADPRARIDEIFKHYTKPGSPGCAVAVYQDDRILYSRAYGMANLDHDVPLTAGSVFHVASVSKQFTAAAILLLAQDGKLSLDDEVRKHVPELPDFGPRITIRHLLHHTSGIRDQWTLLGLAGWRYSRDLITDDDVLALLSRQKDLNFPPGERHLYSNSGFTLLAVIVSRVSAMSFRDFTSKRIFEPLGMRHTHFRDNFNEIVKNQAYGYSRQGDTFRLSVTNFDTAGATSLLTTVEDLAKWNANFENRTVGGDGFVSALLERGVLNDGRRIDYASGITHGTYRGLPTVGHGGSDAGYRSAFVRFPDQRFGVSALCNLAQANPTELTRRVADVYLEKVLQPRPSTPPDQQSEVPVSDEELSRLAGLYWNSSETLVRRFVFENGRLHASGGGERYPMKSLGNGKFVLTPGPGVHVAFDKTRVTVGPTAGTGDVLERAEPFAPTPAQLEEFAGVYRSDEMDAVYRMTLREDGLQLERLKSSPARLEPLVADTFSAQPGIIRFTRDGDGRVTGFALEAGRVRAMKFWKDTAATRSSTEAR